MTGSTVRLAGVVLGAAVLVGACRDDAPPGGERSDAANTAPSGSATTAGPARGSTGSSTPASGPTVRGEIALEGAVIAEGTVEVAFPATDAAFASCEQIAGGAASAYVIPLPGSLGERRFRWTAAVRRYDGPGTFDLEALGTFQVETRERSGAEVVTYTAGGDSAATLEVSAANAGSFTFSGLAGPTGERLSGRLTWSCR